MFDWLITVEYRRGIGDTRVTFIAAAFTFTFPFILFMVMEFLLGRVRFSILFRDLLFAYILLFTGKILMNSHTVGNTVFFIVTIVFMGIFALMDLRKRKRVLPFREVQEKGEEAGSRVDEEVAPGNEAGLKGMDPIVSEKIKPKGESKSGAVYASVRRWEQSPEPVRGDGRWLVELRIYLIIVSFFVLVVFVYDKGFDFRNYRTALATPLVMLIIPAALYGLVILAVPGTTMISIFIRSLIIIGLISVILPQARPHECLWIFPAWYLIGYAATCIPTPRKKKKIRRKTSLRIDPDHIFEGSEEEIDDMDSRHKKGKMDSTKSRAGRWVSNYYMLIRRKP